MASELRVNTLKDASGNNSIATSFVAGGSAKTWINLDGDAGTTSFRFIKCWELTDNGTGDYTIITLVQTWLMMNYAAHSGTAS